MGAKQKLNSLHCKIAAVVAAVLGLAFSSWIVFFLVLGGWIALAFHNRDIRGGHHRRRR